MNITKLIILASLTCGLLIACKPQQETLQQEQPQQNDSIPALNVQIDPVFVAYQKVINKEGQRELELNYLVTRAVTHIDWLDELLLKKISTSNSVSVQQEQKTLEQAFQENIQELQTEYYTGGIEYVQQTYYLGQRNHIASFMLDHYSYMGGAHGYYFSTYINIDLAEKQEITLDHLVKQSEKLQALLWQQYLNYSNNDPFIEKQNFYISDNFYFTPRGIIFSYKPYAIGSFAEGEIELFAPWQALKDIISDRYLYTQQDGVYPLPILN